METSAYKKRVEEKHLPKGAPNILIILMDDAGPGAPSTYGGEVNTPTLSRVASRTRYAVMALSMFIDPERSLNKAYCSYTL